MIEVDLHLHTTLSNCAEMDIVRIAEVFRNARRPIVTATDHGSTDACRRLRELLPDALVIFGNEITAAEGDFLVFSVDEDYVTGLPKKVDTVADLRRDERTAVIWAHPRVSQRARSWEAPKLPDVLKVVPYIDGLETINGTMLSLNKEGVLRRDYFANLVRIGIEYSLAMTGGSDAHDLDMLLRCGTRFPNNVNDAESFIEAIKLCRVSPVFDRNYFGDDVSLSG
ncbi:MAG TPA: PHP-associated domain-containing protein [bacterium]|nr:PHP-associated domain-containing protein [bacterium]